jgi:hypothetical protein
MKYILLIFILFFIGCESFEEHTKESDFKYYELIDEDNCAYLVIDKYNEIWIYDWNCELGLDYRYNLTNYIKHHNCEDVKKESNNDDNEIEELKYEIKKLRKEMRNENRDYDY